jgi:hypothetical protein
MMMIHRIVLKTHPLLTTHVRSGDSSAHPAPSESLRALFRLRTTVEEASTRRVQDSYRVAEPLSNVSGSFSEARSTSQPLTCGKARGSGAAFSTGSPHFRAGPRRDYGLVPSALHHRLSECQKP